MINQFGHFRNFVSQKNALKVSGTERLDIMWRPLNKYRKHFLMDIRQDVLLIVQEVNLSYGVL